MSTSAATNFSISRAVLTFRFHETARLRKEINSGVVYEDENARGVVIIFRQSMLYRCYSLRSTGLRQIYRSRKSSQSI